MVRKKAAPKTAPSHAPTPAPGTLALGVLELAPARRRRAVAGSADKYVVRLTTGERQPARLAAGVSPSFMQACLRDGRMLVLVHEAEGCMIAGALQTQAQPAVDERGNLALSAEHLRIDAKRSIALAVPGGKLALERGGAVRIEGDRLVLDAAAFVRILSSLVEVP